MANALKCDRCGKLYEEYRGIRVDNRGSYFCGMSLFTYDGWMRKVFDLCPKCMTKQVEFIKAGKEEGDGI